MLESEKFAKACGWLHKLTAACHCYYNIFSVHYDVVSRNRKWVNNS